MKTATREQTRSVVRIGPFARQLGLTPRTLRYWEQRSLMPPPGRTPGGSRLYGGDHHQAARGIVRLKGAGFSLDQIEDLQRRLGDSPNALQGHAELARRLDEKARKIRSRIRELQALHAELVRANACLGSCHGCDGKRYDAECVSCLTKESKHTLPDSLFSVMWAANQTER